MAMRCQSSLSRWVEGEGILDAALQLVCVPDVFRFGSLEDSKGSERYKHEKIRAAYQEISARLSHQSWT